MTPSQGAMQMTATHVPFGSAPGLGWRGAGPPSPPRVTARDVPCPALLERDHELGHVGHVLEAARAGNGSLLFIGGSLGIGKSELLNACAQRARRAGLRVLRASCAEQERDFEFGVVQQLLDPALFSAAGQREPASVARHDVHPLIAEMSAEQPLLIVVDDLHAADTASLACLSYLGRRVSRHPVAIVVTVLDGDPGAERLPVREIRESATHTLSPAPLSTAAVRALVRGELGDEADDELVAACGESSAGNPLFLMSMLSEVKATGWSTGAVRRPAGLRERLVSCLSSQPTPVHRLIQTTAVLGESADTELVGRVAGLDECQHVRAVRVVRQLGLLNSESCLGPARLVVRAAAEELTAGEDLDEVHLRAAQWLHQQGHAEREIARYLVEVAAPLDDWALRVLREAVQAELECGKPETAASYLRRALLDSPPNGEDRGRMLVELATAERSFDPSASVRHISQSVSMLTSAHDRAEALSRLSPMVLATSPAPITEMIREVSGEFEAQERVPGDQALRLEARRRYLAMEDPLGLADNVRRLRALGPNPPVNTAAERELLVVLLYAATVASEIGAAEVARLAHRVIEREPAQPGHVHTGLALLANVLVGADAPGKLSSWLDRARGQQQSQGDVVARTLLCTETGLVLMSTGKLDEALAVTREAIDLGGLGWDHGNSATLLTVAFLTLETADRDLMHRVLESGGATGNNVCVTAALRLLKGSVATDRRELGPELQRILDLGQQLDRWGMRNPALCPWRSLAAMMHHRLGDVDEAHKLIEQELELAQNWGAHVAVGRALRSYAMLSDSGKDIRLLQGAISVLSESANRIELARAHLLLGRRLRAAGRSGTEKHLQEARGIALECGVQRLIDRTTAELGGQASATPSRAGLLTPSERQVAMLARTGRTNEEIAREARITSRTVEKHLTKIYRKLGVAGRAELFDALQHPQNPVSG
ncbi:helix-turn-helix transcriptional regulator [Saccharopolyspora dendranthemae]|uniref:Regulatory LuxR family protein n=1 Tax=Saccharopolyspora dendranthemae TaxID=1181886 RepID=A0A561U3F2_9PSEU|nr:AAA family ATPase [Saccharopolyspora dendranthemae]TWF93894.1 regulatory LuxR family protein [Saccharopolyspora dendranthemae]